MDIEKNGSRNLFKSRSSLRSFLLVFFNCLVAFNMFTVLIAGNFTGKFNYSISDSYYLSNSKSTILPLIHNRMNFVMESSIQSEENTESPVNILNFDDVIAYNIHEPFVAILEKSLLNLPSLFFQRKISIPLFILFHSWKNYLA